MKKGFVEKMFWQFMIPLAVSSVGLGLANIADSLVVGMRMGGTGLAAIGIVQPIYMIYALFYVGIGIGGSVEFAKLAGAGKNQKAVDIFNMMMMVSIGIGAVFTVCGIFFTKDILRIFGTIPSDGEMYTMAYQYAHVLLLCAPIFFINTPIYIFIRNDDNPKLSSFGYAIGNLLDVILNFVFVILMDVGVTGSVWSTVIGQLVSVLIYMPHFTGKKYLLRFHLIKPEWKKVLATFKIGFASSNQYISQFLFIALANRILVAEMGHMGVAVFDVVMNVSYIGLLFFQASNDSLQPLASTFHGEGNTQAERKVFRMAMSVGMISGICLLAVIAVFARQICMIFGISGEADVLMGSRAVQIYCLGAVAAGVNIILAGYYQSVGRDNLTFLISIARGTVLLLLFTVLFGVINPIKFWYVFPATEITSYCIFLIFKNQEFFRSRENVVEEERIFSTVLDRNENNISEVLEGIEEFCEKYQASAKQKYYVNMTAEEICSAIMENAFTKEEENMYILITVIAGNDGNIRLCIRDNALAFNPFDMTTKKVELDDDDHTLGGLGIMMVKSKAKEFFYRRYQNFNTLTIVV